MPGAELAGDVELKEYASIWQNCALRGDVNKIVVGRYSNVQDNSVLHVDDDEACILGDYVTIGMVPLFMRLPSRIMYSLAWGLSY